MKTVYVIFENDGDYDVDSEVIGFAYSEKSAKDICVHLDKCHKIVREIYDELTEHLKPVKSEDIGLEARVEVPRWTSGIAESSITEEMRSERDKIEKLNKEIAERNSKKLFAHNQKIIDAVSKYISEIDYGDEINGYIKTNVGVDGGISGFLLDHTFQEIKKLD